MRYVCIISLLSSADGDQRCHFKEKGGITAAEVSTVLLQAAFIYLFVCLFDRDSTQLLAVPELATS